ncbi:MAG: cobalamin biosynthesis protein CobD [Spirochaetales bacterium]|nr:cobalamin biosynthesis protein CobD [Spirochaetales bacterium]
MDVLVILAAFALDTILGDPQWAWHPVRLVGKAAVFFESLIVRFMGRNKFAGLLCFCLVFGAGVLPFLLCWILLSQGETYSSFFMYFKIILGIIMVYFSFAQRDLVTHALAVKKALSQNELLKARERLSWMVSRDTRNMPVKQIIQSSLESLAENYCDSVFAPLFFAALFGPLGAWAYRIINTLDAMWGYKNEKYLEFGFTAARLDDIANFIPSRLSALYLILSSFLIPGLSGIRALKTVIADASKHKSPNSGYPEAAAAGALGIAFGGEFVYFGKKVINVKIGQGEVGLHHFSRMIVLLYISTFTLLGTILFAVLIKGGL